MRMSITQRRQAIKTNRAVMATPVFSVQIEENARFSSVVVCMLVVQKLGKPAVAGIVGDTILLNKILNLLM